MFRYKKLILYFLTIQFIILSIIEFIVYLKIDSSIFGLIYLIVTLFMLFLLIPSVYNYNNRYNPARISKFIIIVLIGLFSSYLLNIVVNCSVSYDDSSTIFLEKVFVIKNILKPILYFGFLILTFFETKLLNVIKKSINKKVD